MLSQETVLEFGKIVKKSVEQQKMLAWQYNTIGVSDGITMGGDGEYKADTPLNPEQGHVFPGLLLTPDQA